MHGNITVHKGERSDEKRIKTTAGILFLGLLCQSGTYGYFSDTLQVVNHISVGDIKISMEEYEKRDKGSSLTATPARSFRCRDIKIPKLQIMHFHAGCVPGFLYTNSVKELEGLNDTNLSGFPAKWIRRGEYYYYTSILKKRICRPVSECTHSDSWEKEHELQKLGMIIQAEAIQAANFTPDFAAMSPWEIS